MKKSHLALRSIFYCLITLLFTFNYSIAQETIIAKRVEIVNPTHEDLLKIKNAGFDLACDAIFKDNNLILEIGEQDLKKFDSENINYTIIIENLIKYYKEKNDTELPAARLQLQQMKAKSLNERSLSNQNTTIDNFIQYEGCTEIDWAVPQNFNLGSMGGCLTYNEVLDELDEMRSLYPNIISVKTDASPSNQVTHGNSFTNNNQYDTWPGQTIYYVRISDNPDTDESNEPESLYSGMTHSREVSSMMNLIYYMWYILENYDTNPGIKSLVDNHEMYFIPVANPDGLLWNEQIAPSGGGLQRKNLGPYNTGNNDDRGVDLNRNYDYFWGSNPIYGGSSGVEADQTYRGPSAFSEPETQIVRDFSATREFKTAMNHHATSNLIPHAYNGYPAATASGREAEFHKFCHDMTRFNRYIYGEAPDILTVANGDMSDWMLGGVADVNGSTGSGQGIMALAPENGAYDNSEGGFWPNTADIVNIAKRAVRMNFVNAYHSGKFAQFHDLNTTDITSTSGNLEFGVEYLGQTLGDITLNVTPVSSNIISITPPATQTGWSKLEQRTLTAAYTLDAGIQANDVIEFQITLSNDDGYIMYETNIIKYYNPIVLASDNPDSTGLTNWTTAGGSWGTTTDAYSGTTAITDSPSGAYGNNENKTITFNKAVDLSSSAGSVVQFYAKWDLERNFDYVQIQGSIDGTNWVTLCGKYTKPGSDIGTNRYSSGNSTNTGTGKSTSDRSHQPSGELIYDADTMDKWVMEEIFIDVTNNNALLGASNVQFRFLFDTDNSNRADGYPTTFDGFSFDDFKIISLASVPCSESIDTFPYTKGFENGLGLWTQAVNGSADDIDWTVNSGSTISTNTGPTGASTGTQYIYTEASTNVTPPGSPSKTAHLISPCIDFTGFENAAMTLDYHMFGADIGTLSVEVSLDSGISYTTVFTLSGQQQGSNDTAWITTSPAIDLSAYDDQIIVLRLSGLTGASFNSDIAVDNINITADVAPSNPPIAVCQDIIVQLDNTGNATIIAEDIDNGSNDDIAITSMSIDIDTFNCSNIGTPATVTLTVEDVDGQTDTCTANVTVEDNINPITPFFTTLNAQCSTTPDVPSTNDNCAGLIMGTTNTTFPITNPGLTVVTWTFNDGNGNIITADQNVNINDTIDPVCNGMDITVQLDEFGNATITGADIDNGSSDNCGIASLTATPNTFTSGQEGPNTVTLTVTDTNNNSVSCDVTVTIESQTLTNQEINDFEFFGITPNPFTSELSIKTYANRVGNIFTIELFDIRGRLINKLTRVNTNGTIKIDEISSIENGSYLLKITDNTSNSKIIKQLIKR